MYFHLSNGVVFLLLALVIGACTVVGLVAGSWLRRRGTGGAESVGIVQGALFGLLGLFLAFGLTMAVGRYENRRDVIVVEANTVGTTYLRAQLLEEPERSSSMELLRSYTDGAIDLAASVPGSARYDAAIEIIGDVQQRLWALADDAVRRDPAGSAPRLYVETLNEMIDTHTERVASLGNRVPTTVIVLQLGGSAISVLVLALYLAALGRGATTSLITAVVVTLILLVSIDLDRPQRGFITVSYSALEDARAVMDLPPAGVP